MISISLCHVVQIAPPSQRPEIVAKRTSFRESFRLKKITRVNSSLMMHPDLPQYQVKIARVRKYRIRDTALFCLSNANVYLQRSVNTGARLTPYKDMYKHM